jgi:hypothetical protein
MKKCENTLKGARTQCWLFRDPNSFWNFCRRCTWNHETNLLESLVHNPDSISLIQQSWFLPAFGHNERRDLMISILSCSYQENQDLYKELKRTIQGKPEILRTLEHAFKTHSGDSRNRCILFRKLILSGIIQPICHPVYIQAEKCLDCLVWSLYTKKCSIQKVINCCNGINSPIYRHLELRRPPSIIGDLYNYEDEKHGDLEIIPNEQMISKIGKENIKDFLKKYVLWHQKWYNVYLQNKISKYWFLDSHLWEGDPPIVSCYYDYRKERILAYKEELLTNSMHPDRIWDWYLDDNEKKVMMKNYGISR